MTKRDLKVGDIVLTEHGDAYCITSLNAFGPIEFINSSVGKFHVSALNKNGILRSIHIDSIVRIVEHTDLINKVYEKLGKERL